MSVEYFTLPRQGYAISCKLVLPESRVERVVLGIHGFNGSKESSSLQVLGQKLAQQGGALLSFDLPAHGNSEADDVCLTVENCMEDVHLAANYCRERFPDIPKAVYGTSYGGYLTLLSLDTLSDFTVILRAPAVTMGEHILLDLLGITADEFKTLGCTKTGFERKIDLHYDFYRSLLRHPIADQALGACGLIIQGSCDEVVPPQDIIRFCARNPGFTLQWMEGAFHQLTGKGQREEAADRALAYWLSL